MRRDFEKTQLRKEKVLSSIQNVLQQVATKNINSKDMELLVRILDVISTCYRERVNTYLDSYGNDKMYQREERYYDWAEGRNSNDLPEPKINDCVKGIRNGIPMNIEDNINFFPSEKKGICRPQCVVLSTGDWEFGDTKFRNDILSYWYRCFYTNRFTLIFTESWQHTSWQKWKQLVDAYVAEQKFEIRGQVESVDHTVVIIEYSEDGVQLRYFEKSI
jgi:hypothetical protein